MGDGHMAVEDYLRAVHWHNHALALKDSGVPLPANHYTGDLPVSTETLLHSLPLDVVSSVIWPALMNSACHLENYRTCCVLRCVSKGWREYVVRQREWTLGGVANARHRQFLIDPVFEEYESSVDSDSSSDSEYEELSLSDSA